MSSNPTNPADEKRRGAALVEMAIVLPLFFMIVLGIIEFGRAMMVSNMVTNAAREGARLAILDGTTNSDVNSAITDFLTASLGVSAANVNVTINCTPAPSNPDPGDQIENCISRDLIEITVEVPFNTVSLLPGNFLAGKNLVGKSSMRHE